MTKNMDRLRTLVMAVATLAVASSVGAAQDAAELPREDALAACLEMREKVHACRDEFAAQAVDQVVAARGKPATAEERRNLYEAALAKATREGSGPVAPRRVLCEKMVEHVAKSGLKATRSGLQTFTTCFEKPDCRARIRCYLAESAKLFPPAPAKR